ncbi:MAG TPA: class I SAM-dependent methyltransferase [Polyangiaceae bacterium]
MPRFHAVRQRLARLKFGNSRSYWEKRYATGGNSGAGSYGRLSEFKAEFLNRLVAENDLRSVVEFGSGDGNQLSLASYPEYLGLDVSTTAIERCRKLFAADESKKFSLHDATVDPPLLQCADLALSLDVIYHLVEDSVFDAYMRHLFDAARRAVVIYASNEESKTTAVHVRHREFTAWVERHRPDFQLKAHVPNRYPPTLTDGGETSFADFYVFAPQHERIRIPANLPRTQKS